MIGIWIGALGDLTHLVYDAERLLSVGICADGQDDAAVMIADQLAELAFRHIFRGNRSADSTDIRDDG